VESLGGGESRLESLGCGVRERVSVRVRVGSACAAAEGERLLNLFILNTCN